MKIHMNRMNRPTSTLISVKDGFKESIGVINDAHKNIIVGVGEVSIAELPNGYKVVIIDTVIRTAMLVDDHLTGIHSCYMTSGRPDGRLSKYLGVRGDTKGYEVIYAKEITREELSLKCNATIVSEISRMIHMGGYFDASHSEVMKYKSFLIDING